MKISEFNYHLPKELIAQTPASRRDESKLMVLDRKNDSIEHKKFYNILEYLNDGDCLVMNNSRVIPARLFGEKALTGAKIEFLLIKRIEGDIWEAMVRPGKRLKPGDKVIFSEENLFEAEIIDYGSDGTRIVEFKYEGVFYERLEELGKMPLPPYIDRESNDSDKLRYQTVYSEIDGSVAAPTAGLHFTDEILDKLRKKGVKIAYVTLHVGIGTFKPVKCENIQEHKMHFEEYYLTEENAEIINSSIEKGERIVAVGTTSVRTLESIAKKSETGYKVESTSGSTGIFIYPGYEFKVVDSIITNFHLPKSTLLMLISAFYEKDKILDAYEQAVNENYRFFSYGDAMLII
ncbi:MAG: tRNA preQ1(34) S-adenosylmethionine ribosyltransferase-isomerase QueA [Clostridiales bacterium]|nr:tRNA preQ1(34) S-adenosylmethionine ribosyltransferase-isomerase QueA [Clostridiales bacterium]